MTELNFTTEDIENLLKIKKLSDERIKCLKDMIKHEEYAQLNLRPVLRKYCKHEWNEDEECKLRCSKCTLLKEIT